MLDSLSPRRRRFLLSGVAVLGAVVVIAVGVTVVRGLADEPRAAQDEPGPVLLVPGYAGDVDSLEPLDAELRALGRRTVIVRPADGGTGDLKAQADRLGAVAAQTLARSEASSVDVVGYSAGGVVARLWVKDGDGGRLARRVLTLGSPHHGSDVAALATEAAGSCPTACEQLVPDSDLLRRLNASDETPDGPRWITVRSTSDTVVTPTDSASLSGALDVLVQQVCPGSTVAHGQLPSDPVVRGLLASALGTAAPALPEDVSC